MTFRGRAGYIDPIMALMPFTALIVLFLNPRFIAAIAHSPPDGLGWWMALIALSVVSLVIQASAIAVCIGEAHQDALSGGERSGFNRAPALSGLTAPFALALLYIGGLWPLMRLDPRPTWAMVLNIVLALGIVGGGWVANKKGRTRSEADRG